MVEGSHRSGWQFSRLHVVLSGSLLTRVVGRGLLLGAHLLVPKLMSLPDYGSYAYTLSWTLLLSLLSIFGGDLLLLRFIAVYSHQLDWARLAGVYSRTVRQSLAVSIASGAVGVGASVLADGRGLPSPLVTGVAALLLPVTVLTGLQEAAIRGLGYPLLSQLGSMWVRPSVFLALAAGLSLYRGQKLTPADVLLAYLGSSAVTAAVVGGILHKVWPREARHIATIEEPRNWTRISATLAAASAGNSITMQVDVLIVGVMCAISDVGLYNIAARLATLTSFFFSIVDNAVASEIAKLHTAGKREELQALLTRSSRVLLGTTFLLGSVLFVSADWILPFFGPAFAASATPLRILILGWIALAATGPIGFLMSMTGHQRVQAVLVASTGCLAVILNIGLIMVWGMAGAAIATSVALVTCNILQARYAFRTLHLSTSPFRVVKPAIPSTIPGTASPQVHLELGLRPDKRAA